jgi:hypothetical protein
VPITDQELMDDFIRVERISTEITVSVCVIESPTGTFPAACSVRDQSGNLSAPRRFTGMDLIPPFLIGNSFMFFPWTVQNEKFR